MSEQTKIRKRSRPPQGPAIAMPMDVDQDIADRSQALVEQAIEAAADTAEAAGDLDHNLPSQDVAAQAASEEGAEKEGNYSVGKGKPPKHSQFQKGKSGNPNGRPRKEKERPDDRLERLLEEKQTVNINGKQTDMSMREIGERRMVQNYAKGELKTVAFVDKMLERNRVRKAAEAQSDDDGMLQAPSAEVLQMMAEAKAAELRADSRLPELDDQQIDIILAIFGLGGNSAHPALTPGIDHGAEDAFDNRYDEEDDGADDG